jgi:phosphoribosylaminoimidazole (AIR) synthetase
MTGLLDGGWTDAGAGSDELACCVADALVDDSEPVVIGNVACVFKPVDGLSHRLVWGVEVLGDTADGVTTLDGERTWAAVPSTTSHICQLPIIR